MSHYFRLGVDLVKIKEGMVEHEPIINESCNSDNESNQDDSSPEDSAPSLETDISPLPLRFKKTFFIFKIINQFQE